MTVLAVTPDHAAIAALIERFKHVMPKSGAREYSTSDAPRQRPAVYIQTTRDDVLKTEYRQGCLIEHLTNGDIRVNGLLIERPDGWPDPTRWTMLDARGNLIVGSAKHEPILVLRDPTLAEARAELNRVAKELENSGEAPDYRSAFKMARQRLPLHDKVYSAA
jgi:hypothetical protein